MSEGIMAVRSRLKIVLAEYNTARIREGQSAITIRDLAADMKLSPSVITGLTANRARRIDFETLNKLCRALSCTPGDILEYSPDQS